MRTVVPLNFVGVGLPKRRLSCAAVRLFPVGVLRVLCWQVPVPVEITKQVQVPVESVREVEQLVPFEVTLEQVRVGVQVNTARPYFGFRLGLRGCGIALTCGFCA